MLAALLARTSQDRRRSVEISRKHKQPLHARAIASRHVDLADSDVAALAIFATVPTDQSPQSTALSKHHGRQKQRRQRIPALDDEHLGRNLWRLHGAHARLGLGEQRGGEGYGLRIHGATPPAPPAPAARLPQLHASARRPARYRPGLRRSPRSGVGCVRFLPGDGRAASRLGRDVESRSDRRADHQVRLPQRAIGMDGVCIPANEQRRIIVQRRVLAAPFACHVRQSVRQRAAGAACGLVDVRQVGEHYFTVHCAASSLPPRAAP